MSLGGRNSDSLLGHLGALKKAGAGEWLGRIRRGIEREALRTTADGRLAQSPHPKKLGSALTHPHITTDFAEAQLELVTGVHESVSSLMQELGDIHAFVWRNLGDELLWPMSMPCTLPAEDEIPPARFGNSHLGRFKHLYRLGLKFRYGAKMQAISGLHYNFSLPEGFWDCWQKVHPSTESVEDRAWLRLARNLLRHHWMLIYLFGASPACGDEALDSQQLEPWPCGGVFGARATSLRNSPLGYSSGRQSGLHLSYDSLANHCDDLERAIREPVPQWAELTKRHAGPVQLGEGLLQIENELYAPVRMKCTVPGLRPLAALRKHGIQYIEVRSIDLDPDSAVGISAENCHLLDLLLIACLCLPDEPMTERDWQNFSHNNAAVSLYGRDFSTAIRMGERSLPLGEALADAAGKVQMVAEELVGGTSMETDWAGAALRLAHLCTGPEESLSQLQLDAMEDSGQGFCAQGLQLAAGHRVHWAGQRLKAKTEARMQAQVQESWLRQKQEEELSYGSSFQQWLDARLKL